MMHVMSEFEATTIRSAPTSDRPDRNIPALPTPVTSKPATAESTDNDELIRRICRFIKRETHLGIQDMRVFFEDDCLVLHGYCRTFYAKQLAQEAAMTLLGDIVLINNIRVIRVDAE